MKHMCQTCTMMDDVYIIITIFPHASVILLVEDNRKTPPIRRGRILLAIARVLLYSQRAQEVGVVLLAHKF